MPVLGVIFVSHAYAQAPNHTTSWRFEISMAIPGIEGNIAHGDTVYNDRHQNLKADYILTNPPFNDSAWRGKLLKDDQRWLYGVPGHDFVRTKHAAKNNGEVLHG
jgi:type I restriction-modification system DNA methylase subunit